MHLSLHIGVGAYGVAIRIASLFLPKAKKWVSGRKNWTSNLPDTKTKK